MDPFLLLSAFDIGLGYLVDLLLNPKQYVQTVCCLTDIHFYRYQYFSLT